jgi:hypothetical protein
MLGASPLQCGEKEARLTGREDAMTKSIAIAVVSCLAILVAADGNAFAQAGSTGGTIGKTDKSASGGDKETEPQRRSIRPSKARTKEASSCARLVGVWSWYTGGDVTFKSGGTFVQPEKSLTGTWTCKNDYVVMLWSHGYTDRVTLSRDGTHLEGTNGFNAVSGDRK